MATDGIGFSRSQPLNRPLTTQSPIQTPLTTKQNQSEVDPVSAAVSQRFFGENEAKHSIPAASSTAGDAPSKEVDQNRRDSSISSSSTGGEKLKGGSSSSPSFKESTPPRTKKVSKKLLKEGSRNSFFNLLSQYKPVGEIRDQRSPGPLHGQLFRSPEEIDELPPEDYSPNESFRASSSNRNSPLQWLAKMGVGQRDGNSVIAIKRPSLGDLSVNPNHSISSATPSPRLSSPKRKGASSLKKSEKHRGSGSGSGSFDRTEMERLRKRSFAHFDTQSMAFNLAELVSQGKVADVKHQKVTGASAAAKGTTGNIYDAVDKGDGVENEILASCPFFRNEIGSKASGPSLVVQAAHHRRAIGSMSAHETIMEEKLKEEEGKGSREGENGNEKNLLRSIPATGMGEFEFIDRGAVYYRKYFYGQDHQNYAGIDENLGPIAISLRREPMMGQSGAKEKYQYRVIVRTSDLIVLRGSIPEDSIPAASKPGSRGLPAKDVLEFVAGELQLSCLRLAQTGKVPEQLLRLDEEGLSTHYRIGVMYCKEGQSSEDEMYRNEHGSDAFEHFLTLLGEKIVLKGFQGYRAQLDTKSDSTGTHSVFTSFHNMDIMFHVSTLLPFTPNSDQQVLRKRHIGNDIVTIVFQEPGSQPFSPSMIRSNFQHIFIVVHLLSSPESKKPHYGIAVSRSMEIPFFGPKIPSSGTFIHGSGFREFLLTKALNGENAAKKSAKFADMAKRTRKEYLLDLAKSYSTNQSLESAFGLYGILSRAVKRRDKNKPHVTLETAVKGAITWHVQVEGSEFSNSNQQSISCVLGISIDSIVLVDENTKQTIFSIPSKTVIGWTSKERSLKLYYNVGEFVTVRWPRDSTIGVGGTAAEGCGGDVQEIIKRLSAVTSGCEAQEMQLRKTASSGNLGFVLHGQGLVGDVDEYSYVYQAGLRKGSRLVEIGDMPVHGMDYENLVQLLQIAGSVHVIVIPPLIDGQARGSRLHRQLSWSSLHTPSGTPDLVSASAEIKKDDREMKDGESEEREQEKQLEEVKLPNTIPRRLTSKSSRPASADRIRKKHRMKSRSAGSLSESSWYKEESSCSSSSCSRRSVVDGSDLEVSENEGDDEEEAVASAREREKNSRSNSASSNDRGDANRQNDAIINDDDDDDEVESSDAEANFDARIGTIVETANRLAEEKEIEAARLKAHTRSLPPPPPTVPPPPPPINDDKKVEKTVVSSATLPTPTRPRVKNLDLAPFSTETTVRAIGERHRILSPLEEALQRIGCLEEQVRTLTENLFQIRDENVRLRRELDAERVENANLRRRQRQQRNGEAVAGAFSETSYFSDWYNDQQMTSDL